LKYERQPTALKDLLAKFLRGTPLQEGLERQSALTAWPEIVGEEIASHSVAEALQDGVLRVRVESSVWAQELSMLERQILRGFDERMGKGSVREIRFHSGSA
jgi:predicted nucleic acid-binding Zn ribbon protein